MKSFVDVVFPISGFDSVLGAIPTITTPSVSPAYGGLMVAATSCTTSSVTVRLYNNSDAQLAPTITLFVIGV